MRKEMLMDMIKEGHLAFDVECGNASGFYSRQNSNPIAPTQYLTSFKTSITGQIAEDQIHISEEFSAEKNWARRELNFEAQSNTRIYDLVSRFVVFSNNRPARIADTEIVHRSSNLYYQYQTESAIVPIGNFYWLRLRDLTLGHSNEFERVFYVRDASILRDGRFKWVVHHRLIVKEETADLILRCCNPRFEGPLPLQHIIPRFIKKNTYRIRETQWPSFPFMSVGEISLSKGVCNTLTTQLEIARDF